MADPEVKAKFLGDASQYEHTLKRVEEASGKTGSVMHGIFSGIGIGIADLAAQGVEHVVGFLQDSSKVARDAEVTTTRLTTALHDNVKGFTGDASAMQGAIDAGRKLGFTGDEMRASLSALVTVTKSKEQATKDASAAEDLARARGIDLASATNIIIKAQEGNLGALKKLGIIVPAITTNVDALKASHQKATPEQLKAAQAADKQANATAALAAVQKAAKGQAEAYAGTMQGSLAVAGTEVEGIQEKLGDTLNRMVATILPPLVHGLGAVADLFGQLVGAAEPFVTQVVDLAGQGLAALSTAFNQIAAAVKPLLPVIADLAHKDLAALGTVIRAVAGWVISTLIPAIVQVVKAVLPPLTAALRWLANDVFPAVAAAIQHVASRVIPLIVSAIGWVTKNVLPALGTAFDWIVKNVLPPVSAAFGWIANNVLPLLGKAFDFFTGTVIPAWSAGMQAIGSVAQTAIGILGNIIGAVQRVISFLSGAGSRITQVVSGMWDGIWSAFKNVINTIIRGWNSLQFSVPSIDMGPLGHIGGFSIGTPNIPYLHSGGIVPGSPGSDVFAILQAGERVVPRGASEGAVVIQLHVSTPVLTPGAAQELADAIGPIITRWQRGQGILARP